MNERNRRLSAADEVAGTAGVPISLTLGESLSRASTYNCHRVSFF